MSLTLEIGSFAANVISGPQSDRLDRWRRVHSGTCHENASVDDKKVVGIVSLSIAVHYRSLWVIAHPCGPHQVPSGADVVRVFDDTGRTCLQQGSFRLFDPVCQQAP